MRKRILIIVAIVIVLLGALFLVAKNSSTPAGDTSGIVQKTLNLFPFGKNETTLPADNQDTTIITTDGGIQTIVDPTEIPRLRKLSTRAVAGTTGIIKKRIVEEVVIPVALETETTETIEETLEPTYEDINYVRFIEKATGNIYDIANDEASAVRITNTTIPRIAEAYFTNKGDGVIVRYLSDDKTTIATWHGSIVSASEGNLARLAGNFLEDNITTLSVSPDTTSIFYIRDIGDVTYGYTALANGTNIKQIFDSSFSEWISEWSRPDEISLTAKATGYLEGYSYALSIDGSLFTKKIGPVFGLTRLTDTTGNYSLYSFTTARGMQLRLLDETTGIQNGVAVNTFPEKCVWSKLSDSAYCAVPSSIDNRVYPDDWYQGQYFTTDTLWKIDASSGVGFLIADISTEGGENIDAVSLGLTPNEDTLYFTNKRDGILWGIQL